MNDELSVMPGNIGIRGLYMQAFTTYVRNPS